MTIAELEARLDRLGIVLSARGDKLHFKAPPGVLTPALKTELAACKSALLARLVNGETDATNTSKTQGRQSVACPSPRLDPDFASISDDASGGT
jgi:hypothetical protein